jgi:hypothetical protein
MEIFKDQLEVVLQMKMIVTGYRKIVIQNAGVQKEPRKLKSSGSDRTDATSKDQFEAATTQMR